MAQINSHVVKCLIFYHALTCLLSVSQAVICKLYKNVSLCNEITKKKNTKRKPQKISYFFELAERSLFVQVNRLIKWKIFSAFMRNFE